jgi:hypothetical protein
MATTTIYKRIQFARQFMHDAVDWKIIDENPFCKVKTQKSSVKVNAFVPREVVDKLMKKANPVWQVILGLSRYPVFLNQRTHGTHVNKTISRCVMLQWIRRVLWFPALRGQERIRGRRSAVSSGSQHGDGLEERKPTN